MDVYQVQIGERIYMVDMLGVRIFVELLTQYFIMGADENSVYSA